MSRSNLQSTKSQGGSKKHKARVQQHIIASICLVAVVVAAVALWGDHLSRVAAQAGSQSTGGTWEDVAESSIPTQGARGINPRAYRTLRLDMRALRGSLANAPMEFTKEAKDAPVIISFPLPDGKFGRFKVVESPMMEAGLAAKHPEFKTYSGIGVDDPTTIMRFGLTSSGFHAIILAPSGTVYIDPYAKGDTEHYISYYKQDLAKEGEPFHCAVSEDTVASKTRPPRVEPKFVSFGFVRFYRLAMAATASYTNVFRLPGDTDVQARDRAFDAITTTVNRVNSIFGRDLGVRLVLINNEKDIIYVPTNDPYISIPGTTAILNENQTNLDNVIGNDNYDIGHVVGANGSGRAQRPSVCINDLKAKGSTGRASPAGDPFDVDYVAHEIGHQLNAEHTFNDNVNGSCGSNNRVATSAYEPGSGSTVMGYAGICNPADLQPNSDDYFHAKSVEDIRFYVHDPGGDGSTCGNPVPSGNLGLNPSISLIRTIPSRTPFRLYAGDFADPDPGDAILHTWEEYDLGLPSPPEGDGGDRPLFRSYKYSRNSDRILPSLQYILNNANGPPVTYNCAPAGSPPRNCLTGETLPVNTRTMFFRLTLRDNRDAVAILDNVTINIDSNSGPFFVFSELSWPQGTSRTVTWGVANTNSPPINCANVKITLSTDGGNNFSYVLAESTPNDGSETIIVPQVNTTQARIKVEAVGNIFFDISDSNFSITAPTVTTADDTGGDNLNPVSGSLREAIIAANNLDGSAGAIPILFNIPGGPTLKTINLQKELPALNNRVFIDGWSQGGAGYTGPPLIELNGQFATPAIPGGRVTGMLINSGGSGTRVRGLIINRFTGNGIWMFGSSNNIVEGCYIGTDATGSSRLPNGDDGIRIANGSGNKIGMPGAGLGNVISGNGTINGIDAIEISSSGASGNIVQNNLIGLNAAGTAILSNNGSGVHIINAPATIIGGPGAETRNIISGQGVATGYTFGHGILIEGSSASGTMIQGNYIGTNSAGTADLGNNGGGIYIDNAPNTVIGGLTLIETGLSERNVISGNNNYPQIYVLGSTATGTRIKGNYVGLNATGDGIITAATGIRIETSGNTIGGTGVSDGNVISGNGIGIEFFGVGASANVVQGNRIGTDKTGTVDLGNSGSGIHIFLGRNNLIGGLTPAARNLISGNNNVGIQITGNSTDPQGNLVQGNYIGTNAAGSAAIGSSGASGAGIILTSVKDVTIGGTAPGAGNLISGNGNSFGSDGVFIGGNPSTAIVVQGNLIGTNAAGTAALGNTGRGILVSGFAGGVTIGGASPAARNVIAANAQYGIQLSGSGNNVVKGNLIGTDAKGTANLRNSLSGIYMESGNNIIGGPGPGEGNIIAFNGVNTNYSGIQAACCSTGNTIRGNSIFSNASLGIDIDGLGLTPNDNCDADTGGNNRQNFPVLTAAINGAGNIRVEGTLNSTASSTFTLDFYSNAACDGLNGEGKTYLGSATVMTAANCIASFAGENAITLGVTVPAGQVVTATATDAAGSTSEFSTCVQVTGLCGAISPTSQTFTRMGGSGSVTVMAAAGCSWTAVSNATWIIIVSEAGGAGNAVVSYELKENDAASRTGTMTIAEQVFTVTQSGNCTYSIAPGQRTHPAAGGAGSINVTADAGCNWTAVSNAAWITINMGNGSGNGTATYTVAPNAGPGRSGTITVAGQTFTVKQKKG